MLPCQGRCREFEPRLSLIKKPYLWVGLFYCIRMFIIRDFDIKERKFDILVGRFLNGITIHKVQFDEYCAFVILQLMKGYKMSSSEPKNHHYIPQAQLRLFKLQNFENSILQYDKLNNEIKQKNIAKVACSKYFYKVSEKSANDPFYAEKFFSKIEDNGIDIIKQLSESKNPSYVSKNIGFVKKLIS